MNIWYHWIADRFFKIVYIYSVIDFSQSSLQSVWCCCCPFFRDFTMHWWMNLFIHSWSQHPHTWYQKKALWAANQPKISHMGSVYSASQNQPTANSHVYICSHATITKKIDTVASMWILSW